MSNNTIMIDGIKYQKVTPAGERREIVCVDSRGLTFVGMVDFSGDDEFVTIRDAQCIIRWGTSKHIAELTNGMLDKTILGAMADVIVLRRNVVFRYVVKSE